MFHDAGSPAGPFVAPSRPRRTPPTWKGRFIFPPRRLSATVLPIRWRSAQSSTSKSSAFGCRPDAIHAAQAVHVLVPLFSRPASR